MSSGGTCHDLRVPQRSTSAARRPWHVLVSHGAGSTLETAELLFGPYLEAIAPGEIMWEGIDDRTGDVEAVAERIGRWLSQPPSTAVSRLVCGISLGAHAALIAIGRETRPTAAPDGCIAALPAWTGEPDGTAAHTAETGRRIAVDGWPRLLHDISEESPQTHRWLIDALRHDWSHYTRSQLAASLHAAAGGCAPNLEDLGSVTVPTLVIGARDDQLHPIEIARSWADALPDGRLVEIDFLEIEGFVSSDTLAVGTRFAERIDQRRRMSQGSCDGADSSLTPD